VAAGVADGAGASVFGRERRRRAEPMMGAQSTPSPDAAETGRDSRAAVARGILRSSLP